MANTTNSSVMNLTEYNETMLALCPLYTPNEEMMVQMAAFWIDGVAKTILAAIGIISNIMAGYILYRPKMRNSFNLCLVALAWIDTIYLIVSMLESIKRRFGAFSSIQVILYPQLLYPLSHISLTASIYLIVAITLERYCAVHYPLDYRQATNEPALMKRRMWRYLGPVLLISVAINFSKFFEAYVVKNEDGEYSFEISPLRRNMTYSAVTNWMRLILVSFLPLVIIFFFNIKVYRDVQERSQRVFNKRAVRISTIRVSKELKEETELVSKACIELRPLEIEARNNEIESDRPSRKSNLEGGDSPLYEPALTNENRRKAEDKLAVIFLVIILGFIFCHLPRVALDAHEIFTLEHYNKCKAAHMPNTFPAWSYVAINVSHFCLALNATMNMYIYCFMSTRYREEFVKVMGKIKSCYCNFIASRKPAYV